MKFILDEWYGKNINFWYTLCQNINLFLHLAFTAPLSFIITINVGNTNIFNQNISSIDENECRDSIRWWKFGCQTLIIFWHFKLKAKKKQSCGNADKKAQDTDSRDSIFDIMTRVKTEEVSFGVSLYFEHFECHSKNNLFNGTVYSSSHHPNPVSVNWINKHFIFIWFNIYLILYHGLHEATVALDFPTTSSILAMWWSWIGCLLCQMLEKSINVHYKT